MAGTKLGGKLAAARQAALPDPHRSFRLVAAASALVLSVCMSGVGGALAAGEEEPQPPDLSTPQNRALAEKAAKEYELEQATHDSPVAGNERANSREAYAGLDDASAVDAAREAFPGFLTAPVMRGLPLEPDQHVVDWLSDRSAIITTGEERRQALLESTIPLRVRDSSGVIRPVDLRLSPAEGGFSPQNPVVPVTIPARSDGRLTVGDRDFGIQLLSPSPTDGVLAGDRVFFPNVDIDTDAIALAQPHGAEVMWVVRSPNAPPAQELELSLPEGMFARMASDGSTQKGAIELIDDGGRVGVIRAPFAQDADGRTVPASYEFHGSRVEVRFPHASRDVAYPILVDPTFSFGAVDTWEFPNGAWGQSSSISPWIYPVSDCCGAGWEAYPGNGGYRSGDYGQYYRYAPPGAYIYKAEYGNVTGTYNKSAEFGGLWNPNTGTWEAGAWEVRFDGWSDRAYERGSPAVRYWAGSHVNHYRTYCANWECWPSGGTVGNAAVQGLVMHGGTANNGVYPDAWFDYAYLYLSDRQVPTITSVQHSGYAPNTWVDSFDPEAAVYVAGSVPTGLGIASVGASGSDPSPADCSGGRDAPCPLTYGDLLTYKSSMWEGVNPFNAWVRTVGGTQASDRTWSVNLDTSPPDAPSIGGEGWGDTVLPGRGIVTVSATDGTAGGSNWKRRSGVKEIELRVWRVGDSRPDAPTDKRTQTNASCGPAPGQTDSCPLSATLRYDTSDYDSPDEPTTKVKVQVLVRDFLGHERIPPPRVVTIAEPKGMIEELTRPPSNITPPTVTGTTREAEALTADEGTWAGGKPMAHDFQWRRCDQSGGACQDIPGAKEASYQLGAADVGATIRVAVKAINAGGTAEAVSASTILVETPLPPSNVHPPKISGTPREAEQLIAGRGTWSGSATISYDYRWQRCDAEGASCVDIDGARFERYAAVAADVGSTLRSVVRATNKVGSSEASSVVTRTVEPKLTAPANNASPKIVGVAREGEVLSAEAGAWGGSEPIVFDYQWLRCSAGGDCSEIPGAKAENHVLTAEDVGVSIRVRVTATNAKASSQAISATTAQVQSIAAPTNLATPTIHGTPRQGEELSGSAGSWSGFGPASYEYQWRRCDLTGSGCADIDGATAESYVPMVPDVGTTLRLAVKATNAFGTSEATSDPTGQVQPPLPPANSEPPQVAGIARHGEVLTAETGSWSGTTPITYAYQWHRCDAQSANCSAIPGETQDRYLLQEGDVGQTARVTVTATNAAGLREADSGTTQVVRTRLRAPENGTRPAISGDPREGEVLVTEEGDWSGSEPVAYSHQWRRCDQTGQSCTDIEAANGDTYVAQAADAGATLRVAVQASNAVGSSASTSDPTPVVESASPVLHEGDPKNSATSRVSVNSSGAQAILGVGWDWYSRQSMLSADGEHLAFASASSNLAGWADGWGYWRWDGNGVSDVFARDRIDKQTERVSEGGSSSIEVMYLPSEPPKESRDPSSGAAISGDGRQVAFVGYARDLAPAYPYDLYYDYDYEEWRVDYPYTPQVFLRDRTAGTSLVSISSSGSGAYGESGGPAISADGRYVAFWSHDEWLTYDAWNRMPDYFVHDTVTKTTERVSLASAQPTVNCPACARGHGGTQTPAISADGRYVAFVSDSADLVPGDTNGSADVFVRDRIAMKTTRVSVATSGAQADSASGAQSPPAISADGTLVAFDSYATNLDAEGASCQLYVHSLVTGETKRVSSGQGGDPGNGCSYQPSLATGRVAFVSDATNLVSGDTNSATDVFVTDIATGATVRASLSASHQEANAESRWPSISVDGRFVSFETYADNLVSGDTNGSSDVFLYDLRSALPDSSTLEAQCLDVTQQCYYEYVGNTSRPTVSGNPREGEFLHAQSGSWEGRPTTYGYQWRRCDQAGESCADIAGAGANRYLLAKEDVGSRIQVRVFASNTGNGGQADSVPTAQVQSGTPANTRPPTISGTAREGEVLRGEPGRWSGPQPIAYDGRWRRCDPSGDACEDIPGARGERYMLAANDVGSTIRFATTATNANGQSEHSSEPSGWVQSGNACPGSAPSFGEDLDTGFQLPCEVLPDADPIYHAVQYEGDPTAGGLATAQEWIQLGTDNARREDFLTITTRGIVPCPENPIEGCGETRYKTREGESDPTAADDFAVTRGDGPHDPRLDIVADIAAPAEEDLSEADDIGPLADILQPWQDAPPLSDGRYALYEIHDDQWVDGEPLEAVDRLWIDFETELPIKQTRTVGTQTEQEIYYDYDQELIDPGAAPPDLFLATPPANVDEESFESLATKPALPDPAALLAPPSEAELTAQALRFREQFGLSTDPVLVASTLDDPGLEPSIADWGVPLTLAEQDEMALRLELVEALPEIDAYAAQNAPNAYAGVWIDQAAGGIVKAGFTQDVATHTNAIKAFFPHPERLEGFSATLTEAQLNALQDEIFADVDDLVARGIDVREVGARVSTNSVEVGLPVPNPLDEQRLREIYGANVKVIQSAPVPSGKKKDKNKKDKNEKNDNNHKKKKKDDDAPKKQKNPDRDDRRGDGKDRDKRDGRGRAQHKPAQRKANSPPNPRVTRAIPPLTGGLHIESGDTSCTSGFTVAHGSGSERVYGVLTAGHCGKKTSAWRHPGWSSKPIGHMTENFGRAEVTNADVAEIRVSPTMRSGQVLLHDNKLQTISGFVSIAEQYEGMTVCLAGATEERHRCGHLRSASVDVRLADGTKLQDQGKVIGTGAKPGDSGGAVFSGEGALGIQSATNDQIRNAPDPADYFSQIQFTLSQLGAQLVTTEQVPYFGFNDDWAAFNPPSTPAEPDPPGWVPDAPWPKGSSPSGQPANSVPYKRAFDIGATDDGVAINTEQAPIDTNRLGVPWDQMQPMGPVDGVISCLAFSDPAQVSWPGTFEQAYERMLLAGVRPIIVLSAAPECHSETTRCGPSDTAPPDLEPIPGDTDLVDAEQAWKDYVAAAAYRFDQAIGFEVWNEPNLGRFWGGCPDDENEPSHRRINAVRYAKLVQLAKEAIVEVRGDYDLRRVPIVTGGLSPAGADWKDYLNKMLKAGAAADADAIALHPYRQKGDHTEGRDFAAAALRHLRDAREVRAKYGVADPFWATEVSVATGSTNPWKRVESQTRAEQASQMAKVYRDLRNHGVPVITFHRFIDGSGHGVTDEDNAWDTSVGVLERDPLEYEHPPKDAYCRLTQMRGFVPTGC
jgi:Tol biopolymer transport system component